ncbi:SDR family oxidoreductase [Evansella sp. AB-P1]|uniref:SDR family oxidoreductase n=1 Tax=Evansella sp. AB-P1 TaxID=3037653 RepID=UPI002420347B|nr:SDR family oxidoreductase [Evansella sp. AB-P1]MDG5788642.1 SDR family oxidoreductase [Evansella sp. AB-P1]
MTEIPFYVDLKEKVVVITGGSGVLGAEFASALAQCGAKVAIIGRDEDKLKGVCDEIEENGGKALGIVANVLEKESLESAHKKVLEHFGPCHILLNGAGGNHPKGTTTKEYFEPGDLEDEELLSFFDLDTEGVRHVFDLNFMGTLLPCQIFSKDMIGKKGCTIINISSMNAFSPLTKIPAYSGAKAAVNNFTQWLAVHMSKVGIRVNAIAPGFFITSQNEKLLLDENGDYTDRAEKIIGQTPMDRFGEKNELVGTLLYLVDANASGFVNGVVIPVDGGFSAYSGV